MTITIDGNGIITGAETLTSTVVNPTFTTPNINSAQFATVVGTAPIYPCRSWVNFNGTGTVAIRGSGNVSSITDGGTGIYTVNFTTALTDVNYSPVIAVAPDAAFSSGAAATRSYFLDTLAVGSFRILTGSQAGPTLTDYPTICAAVFR